MSTLTPEQKLQYHTLVTEVGLVLDSDDNQMITDAIVEVLLFERKHRLPAVNPHWEANFRWEADAKDPEYEAWVERQAELFLQ